MIRFLAKKFSLAMLFLMVYMLGGPGIFAEENSAFFPVKGPCHLQFPKDHGPHPGYRTEWWYYTGNVQSETKKQYGFQLTFFRIQIDLPGAEKNWPKPSSAWRTKQLYLAHAALSDLASKRHLYDEKVAREFSGISGAFQRDENTSVYIENWLLDLDSRLHRLNVSAEDFTFNLTLKPLKPPVLHGENGYSRKGKFRGSASCYYSFTRMETSGEIKLNGKTFSVSGLSWMDHEFSSAPLESDLAGWDWFSLQLSDRTELMVYLLRRKDGTLSSASSGTFVDDSGKVFHLPLNSFKVDELETWKSVRSGAIYPSRWRLRVFSLSLDLTIVPNLADQEMRTMKSTGVTYWEGSISLNGSAGRNPVKGQGFVELTGYDKPFDAPL
jgi:predicted secreted hydrolase